MSDSCTNSICNRQLTVIRDLSVFEGEVNPSLKDRGATRVAIDADPGRRRTAGGTGGRDGEGASDSRECAL
jgi:hypothetical protein